MTRTVGANQTLVNQVLDSSGDTFWEQTMNAITPASGTLVTINDTAPSNDRWNLTEVEILGSTAAAAPTVTSANAATFTTGVGGTFTVTTTGNPTSALAETGTLPTGVTFHDNNNGTATITVATTTTPTIIPLILTATNGIGPNATQSFTLTVATARAEPRIDTKIAASGTTTVGVAYNGHCQ